VCPATAHVIARFAAGLADDAVTTLWQAAWGRGAPLVVVPAMNTRMWDYPATRRNMEQLERWGVEVLPPAQGPLACGEHGAGRMPEPEEILERIDTLLGTPRKSRGRILVTGGGTREPIDAVRYIGNHSTGGTAAAMSDAFTALGFEVHWLGGEGAVEPRRAARTERFGGYQDLDRALRRLLSAESYDLVVQVAAVADFSVAPGDASTQLGKLESGAEQLLRLRPTAKLLGRLRDYAGDPGLRVVGFKLTVGADSGLVADAVARQFERCAPDLVVHNDLDEIRAGRHRFTVNDRTGPVATCDDAAALAGHIAELLLEENDA
jgi:phosphopantothenoylcysteine decarboxylase/phosphopantothenate--cysteine ligase